MNTDEFLKNTLILGRTNLELVDFRLEKLSFPNVSSDE